MCPAESDDAGEGFGDTSVDNIVQTEARGEDDLNLSRTSEDHRRHLMSSRRAGRKLPFMKRSPRYRSWAARY